MPTGISGFLENISNNCARDACLAVGRPEHDAEDGPQTEASQGADHRQRE
jgi:hypothetical protein